MTLRTSIDGIFASRVENLWPAKPPSTIGERPVFGRVAICENDLTCDAQADLKVHYGPNKDLHHYPTDHYSAWREAMNRGNLSPGSFEENLATIGLTKDKAFIGDMSTLGTARVQIRQGCQPCWKLNARTGDNSVALRFQKTGRAG